MSGNQVVATVIVTLWVAACGGETPSGPREDPVAPDPPGDGLPSVTAYEPLPVSKTNGTRVYVHYMGWFETPEYSSDGTWTGHWTMQNRNPNVMDSNGRREIASHFYPLVGPYASADPDLMEYHLLLMKLSGIDGLMLGWCGSLPLEDCPQNSRRALLMADQALRVGLDFAAYYGDGHLADLTGPSVPDPITGALADMRELVPVFSRENYIHVGDEPMLLIFGPDVFETELEWTQIFSEMSPKPHFLTLMDQSVDAGANARGEFAWVDRDHLIVLDNFYARLGDMETGIGAAYPGFQTYYLEGGQYDDPNHFLEFVIDHDGVATLEATLALAVAAGAERVQLVTWNDFEEGTMIEPTAEFGFTSLSVIQSFTGVGYGLEELQYVRDLFALRKERANDQAAQLRLDQAFYYFVSLQVAAAKAEIDAVRS
jgi:Glycosyl hydrolase family 99